MEVRRADGGVIAVDIVGDPDGSPVLLCPGLADSRRSASVFAGAAREHGLRVIAADRPGIGGSAGRRLDRVVDWVPDAAAVLDGLGVGAVALLGVSAGGAFAAACAAAMPDRARRLILVSPLGPPGWPTRGMAPGQRACLPVATYAPRFGGWFLSRLATLAHHAPGVFVRLVARELPDADRRALARPDQRATFLANYREAFRQGSRGVAQDLRVLTRPWGFSLESITVPTSVHHGAADTTVPLQHARLFAAAIPGARLHVHPGEGHFSILDAAPVLLVS